MTMPVSKMLVLICICFVHRYLFIYTEIKWVISFMFWAPYPYSDKQHVLFVEMFVVCPIFLILKKKGLFVCLFPHLFPDDCCAAFVMHPHAICLVLSLLCTSGNIVCRSYAYSLHLYSFLPSFLPPSLPPSLNTWHS